MSTLAEMRDAVASGIALKVPQLRDVGVHGGAFTGEELRRFAAISPYAVVVCDGARESEIQATTVRIVADFACYIIVRGSSQDLRDAASLELVTRVIRAVHTNRWGIAEASAPEEIEWRNPYSPSVDKMGIAIQIVVWEQRFEIDNRLDEGGLDDFETFTTRFNLDSFDDAKDMTITLPIDGGG